MMLSSMMSRAASPTRLGHMLTVAVALEPSRDSTPWPKFDNQQRHLRSNHVELAKTSLLLMFDDRTHHQRARLSPLAMPRHHYDLSCHANQTERLYNHPGPL